MKKSRWEIQKPTKTLLILTTLTLALTLGGCTDGYNKKPDNKLKPSPCACNQFVFDSDNTELT